MKKSLLLLTAALTFGSMASAQTTAPASAPQVPALTDVPAGHWAKDAIDRLVSRGIILGYPDGTYRGTQNLTRYEAAVIIARLLDQMRSGTVSTGTIDQETLTSLQNAIQELAADLAALGVRVTDLEENAVSKDDFARLEQRVEGLAAQAGDPEAIANIQAQIDELTARADDYDTLRADVDDNASSIAALNDLTVLLNQDILDLQDRVSAVEAAQADFVTRTDFDNLSTKVTGIDTRVTALERAPKFSIGGTINAQYGRLALVSGTTNFDVDRLTRQTFANDAFTTGLNCPSGVYSPSGNNTGCTDTNGGAYTQNGYISFGVKASNLTTASGAVTVNNAAINFYASNTFNLAGGQVGVFVDNASVDGTFSGQKFDVKYSAYNSQFKFNDYLFANDNDTEGAVQRRGIVANIEATQLPLAPKLTIVAGNAAPGRDTNDVLSGNYYGVRASVNPGGIGTFGVSFAQKDGNGTAGSSRSAIGLDYDLGFGTKNADGDSPFTVTGAWVNSLANSGGTFLANGGSFQRALDTRDQAFFTDVKGDLGVVQFGANFRAIDADFADGIAGMSANDSAYYYGAQGYKSTMPYGPDQVGYGAAIGTNLGPVALGAFVDSYVPYDRSVDTTRTTSFGVAAGAQLGALRAVGFYNNTQIDGDTYPFDLNNFAYNLASPYMDIADVPFAYSSTFGGKLSHDGAAANALVKNLSFTIADAYFYDDRVNDFQIYGNYSGTIAGVKIEPFARYHLVSAPGAGVNREGDVVAGTTTPDFSDAYDVRTYNTYKYGVKISTQPFTAIPGQPSVFFNFANRVTNLGTNMNATTAEAEELFGQTGITFNQFFAPNMKASIGYAYYQGFGVSSTTVASSASGASATYSAAADRFYSSPGGGATNPYAGDNFGSSAGKADGIFGQLDWNGLAANYGVFRYTNLINNTTSVAHGFKVSYTYKF
ncbi:S-layer homology domain-containing protein [Deinococcus hohokamensis]|uniref:S-layer homology domain-containing protein n=1 Tax=Deinococcus hohokamensis TaxID=309883 RepID=A0ABV9IC96_9DEIO